MKKTTFNEKYEYIDKKSNKVIDKEIDIEKACIYEGGYGKIYRIRDKKVKTEFILKKLRKEDPNNSNIKGITDENSFENEKQFLINVKGANIINFIDYFDEDENYYYFVFEKMDGNLNEMLKKKYKNGMPSKLIRKIFSQINSGLKIMHKKGKTHRDLKPENILFSYTNEYETDFIIKIGDFGLSRDLITTENQLSDGGTLWYKAPEVEDGKYSNKCDLYSIGIILYKLKTGEYIFNGLKNKYSNNIKKDTDDPKLNDLIKKLVVIDYHNRIDWEEYFNDPFFKENDEDIEKNEKCKIKIKNKLIR